MYLKRMHHTHMVILLLLKSLLFLLPREQHLIIW
jgi:hypothetical protein